MTTFVMATRLTPEALPTPGALEHFEQRVMAHVRSDCAGVQWLHSWAVLGGFDYIDVFEAPDLDTAMQVSAIFRTFGRVHTEIWPATEWSRFRDLIRALPEH